MIKIKEDIRRTSVRAEMEAHGEPLTPLDEESVQESRARHGENRLSRKKPKSFWQHFISNLGDPVIRILLMALGLNLLLTLRGSDWVETVGIAVSVLLATLISTFSEMGSARAFSALQAREAEGTCRVLRSAGACRIDRREVVVDDLVCLGAGDRIPADGELVRGEIWVDQAAMTGESREVRKCPQGKDREVFRGCAVVRGEGVARVTAVGDGTVLGGISREIQEEMRESPLRLRLAVLAKQISVVGYVAAALVAAAYLFHTFFAESGFCYEIMLIKLRDIPYLLSALLHALTLGLTVLVVAVPEGLPMMIAVVLSANTRRMVRDQVLVRRGAGIEAAGSMDLLFTDKTGTLTEGRLGVGEIVCCDRTFSDAAALWSAGEKRGKWIALNFAANNVAKRGADGRPIGGNATDRALLTAAVRNADKLPAYAVTAECPFDSTRKYSACALRLEDGREVTLIKGAPERLLGHIRGAYDGNGEICPSAAAQIAKSLRSYEMRGERMLLTAIVPRGLTREAIEREAFDGAVFLCAVQLCDRLRDEAPAAVGQLQRAGVQVVMITGDSPTTAESIARSCGILRNDGELVLTGDRLSAMSDFEVREMLPRLRVVARALPADKSRLVRVAQECERVVGMTGDGVNDAPALRRADIGFAMGDGSDVARDAGDVIILDNNLASIVRAVLYGRNIFKSIRKFITLQLTMNFCAVGISMIGPFIGIDAPVTVVQMLWINLIMDTLGGLAFAGEAALPSCLEEPPKRRDTPILCRYMIDQILLLGGYTVALFLFFLKSPWVRMHLRGGEEMGELCHLTAFFALFIFASVFNCFNARSDRRKLTAGLWQNRTFLIIMLLILGVQIVFVYLGGSVLRTIPLQADELAMSALLAMSVLPVEALRKQLWRWRGHRDGF